MQLPPPAASNRGEYAAREKDRGRKEPSKQRNVSRKDDNQYPDPICPADDAQIQPIPSLRVAPVSNQGNNDRKYGDAQQVGG